MVMVILTSSLGDSGATIRRVRRILQESSMYFTKKTLLKILGTIPLLWALMACSPGVQGGDMSSTFAGINGGIAISPTAVTLSWLKSPDFSAYEIYVSYQKDPLAESIFLSTTIENLTPATEYSFKVVGKGSASGVGAERENLVTTWPRFTGIKRVYKNADGYLVAEWDYDYPAEEFLVYYRAEAEPTAQSTNNWATVNARTTEHSYIFKNLTGSTTYFFTVHARYRLTEFERPTKSLAAATNSSFPAPYYDLPKITIGSLPSVTVAPVITSQFLSTGYTSQIYKDGAPISDPVQGSGKATFASTVPLPLGKIDNITLKVHYQDSKINETLTIPNLSTYLKGVVPILDQPPMSTTGVAGPAFMGQATAVGDFNCDGYDDLAVGLPYVSLAQYGVINAQSGAVYIFYGGLSAGGQYVLKTSPAPALAPVVPGKDPQVLTFPDLSLNAQFGYSLASRGNLNGDLNGTYTCDDLIVGAPGQINPKSQNTGNAFVFFGTGNVGLKSPATISAFPENQETCDGRSAGASCTAVRLWPNHDIWPSGAIGGTYSPSFSNGSTNIRFGEAVSFIGDFNADGYEDLAIGAPDASWDGVSPLYSGQPGWNPYQVGYVAIYFGSKFGLGLDSPTSTASQKFRWVKIFPPIVQPGMRFGASIAGGDIDGRNRVKDDNGIYVGGGDIVVGAPGFSYINPASSLFPVSSSGANADNSVTPSDGGWWGSNIADAALGTNPRYGFPQNSGSSRAQGAAFAFFGRSLVAPAGGSNSNNPPKDSFWSCGNRGMTSSTTHFSCLVNQTYRILFPRDDKSYGFGSAVAIVGDKSARDSNNALKCATTLTAIATTDPASGVCRDGNGDSFGDIIIMASDADSPDGRNQTGAVWEFFGNPDRKFEAGATENFKPAGPPYFNTEAACANFILSLLPAASGRWTADAAICAPTRLIPNSVPAGARMGLKNSSIAIGDLTRDGLMDVVVGAPYDNTRGTNAGATYAFTSLAGKGITSNFKKLIRNTTDDNDQFGSAVAVGDFDAYNQSQDLTAYTCSSDGSDPCDIPSRNFSILSINDVAVGAPFEDSQRAGGGGVHLFNSGAFVLPAIKTTSDVDIYDTQAAFQDFGFGDTRIVGDINGDGYDDAVSHIQSFDSKGNVAYDGVVFFGSSIGLITTTFCLNNQTRVYKTGMESTTECYPSRTHPIGITKSDMLLPQKLVRPNNVSARWAEIGFAAGDINGDGFADVAFVDPCYNSSSTNYCSNAQVLAYFGTRAGLQDIVIPSWRPANNDPQIVSRQVTVPANRYPILAMNVDNYYLYSNFLQFGDFNGDGYSDIIITNPQADGPSLQNSTTAKEPYGNGTESITDFSTWPTDSVLTGTKWRCPTGSNLVSECVNGSAVRNHGMAFIFYGSSYGLATPAVYSGMTGTIDLMTTGVQLNFMYGTEDAFALPTASAATQCSSLSSLPDLCIPVATILRNPVIYNIKNGFSALSHAFGSGAVPIRLAKADTFDSLVISAPGYSHSNCQNYADPNSQAPELNQGRIYVYRGSKYGLLAGAKTDYYPVPTDGNVTKCDNMPQLEDTGLGIDAFGKIRALKMSIAGSPNSAEQDSATGGGGGISGRNSRIRTFGLRLTNAGDINGDGAEDLVVSAPYENVYDQIGNVVRKAGAGYVFYGPLCPTDNDSAVQIYIQDPSRINTQKTFSNTGVTIAGSCAGKQLAPQKFRVKDITAYVNSSDPGSYAAAYGISTAGGRLKGTKLTGDINLDGFSDVIFATPNWDDTSNSAKGVGRGIVFFGSPGGLYTDDYPSPVVETLSLNRTKPFTLLPPTSITGSNFYKGNMSTGDLNGDGSMDVMVPSFTYDGNGTVQGIDLGTFFLFY
jgi:hypothetical protein